MSLGSVDVRQVVVESLSQGQQLHTPGRESPFNIESLDEPAGLRVNRLTSVIRWEALNGVPGYIASRGGEVEIGARQGEANPNTLESFLQDRHGNVTQRASYVAPILEAAGVIEILPKEGREGQCVRLLPAWRPQS